VIDRRAFLAGTGAVLLATPLAAGAQPAGKRYRVGILIATSRQASAVPRLLPKALHEAGYVEGQNLTMEWRFADGDQARLSELAADLARLNVDLIVAGFMAESLAAKQATSSIPIVMVGSVDPVSNGLVASLARPGGNVTGMTIQPPEFGGKQVELLKQAVPPLSRVAVVWDPAFPGFMPFYKHAEVAARTLGFALFSVEIRQPSDVDAAFARITTLHANGLAVWPTNVIAENMPRILNFALQNRLPSIYPTKAFMHAGGLMSYAINYEQQYRRIAVYVDKILRGAKPADLPVEQPTQFELVINLKEAKALGLTIPQSLLLRADEIIQ